MIKKIININSLESLADGLKGLPPETVVSILTDLTSKAGQNCEQAISAHVFKSLQVAFKDNASDDDIRAMLEIFFRGYRSAVCSPFFGRCQGTN
jgi:hypothetical protein